MIESEEMYEQLAQLEAEKGQTMAKANQIDGAIKMLQHLIDKASARAIAARAEKDKAEAGVAG